MNLFLPLAVACAALAEPGSPSEPSLLGDRVELAKGKELMGRVLFEDDRVVLIKDERGDVRELARDEVKRVDSLERRLDEVLDRLASLEATEHDELIELGHRAHELGLPGEAELVFLKVVLQNPLDERAREALGHRRVGSSWRAPFEDQWLPLTRVDDLRSKWPKAWELETAHYRLRTNVDLPTAVDTALDLEIAYRAFHDVLGRPLRLTHVERKLDAHVHGDLDSLPLLPDGIDGMFDPQRNTLIVDAAYKLDRGLLFHEVTHQLVHNTHPGMTLGAHEIPLWLNEGLAEFMQVGLAVRPRTFTFDWGEYSEAHLRTQLVAPKLPSLEDVLKMRTSHFRSGRKSLSYALAYTLVDFCMNADSGLRQDELMAFLAEAYARQVEPEDFLTMVAKDPEGFQREWTVYVEEFMQPLNVKRRRERQRIVR